MVKIYPCVVIPSAELAVWHQEGRFQPLEGEALIEAMIKMKTHVPITATSPPDCDFLQKFPVGMQLPIYAMSSNGGWKSVVLCADVYAVVRRTSSSLGGRHCPTIVEPYANAGGREYFLSAEDPARTTVLGFLRLRLPNSKVQETNEKTHRMLEEVKKAFPELRGAAFVRELHTYGQALRVKDGNLSAVQHKGIGRRLMQEAEKIAKREGYQSVAVISGIGVRAYYRDLGYRLAGTYMKKRLI